MTENTHVPVFQSIEHKGTPWTRWAGSFAINSAIIILLLIIPATVTRTYLPAQRTVDVSLVAPRLTPYKPAPRPQVVRPQPKPIVAPPAVQPVRKHFEAPVVVQRVEPPKRIELPPAPVEAPKAVEVAKFEAPKLEVPHRDVFPASSEAPPSPAPVRAIKVGGFGDPNGVPVSTASTKPSMVAQVGSFDLSQGSGHGAGSGSNGRAVVANAGFGDGAGIASGNGNGSGNGHGAVKTGGFGAGFEAAGGRPVQAVAAKPAPPPQTPVEILYKPKPAYTPEAREKKIEGDVQLEVLFSSGGQIQILRLIRGLGYGLDENARAAASQIRFRPSTRNGSPVDTTGTVHIVFQIS